MKKIMSVIGLMLISFNSYCQKTIDTCKSIRNGVFIKYSSNHHIILEGSFKNGLKNGAWIYFNDTSGLVDSIKIYRLGRLIKVL